MSVSHEIHDLKNKRRFELGKGTLVNVFLYNDPQALRSAGAGALLLALRSHYEPIGPGDGIEIESITERVYAFCEAADWQILVTDDTRDHRHHHWPFTDSRYLNHEGKPVTDTRAGWFMRRARVWMGKADLDINDYIDVWHKNLALTMPLHEFLGMTETQYAAWLRDPGTLKDIVEGRIP